MRTERKNTYEDIVKFSRYPFTSTLNEFQIENYNEHNLKLFFGVNRWLAETRDWIPQNHSIDRILSICSNSPNAYNTDDISDSIEDLIVRASGSAFPTKGSSETDLVKMQQHLHRAKTATAELHHTLSTAEATVADQLSSLRPDQNWFDRMYSHLARLEAGWAGENSEAPSSRQLQDFSKLRSILDTLKVKPVVQVEDDGLIGLFWEQPARTFCLSLLGAGKIMGTLSPYRLKYKSWIVDVEDERQLLNRLGDHQTIELFAANAV